MKLYTKKQLAAALKCKTNTFEDWCDIKTSPNYRYQDLFPSEDKPNFYVLMAEHLLCVLGTEMEWEDGYLQYDSHQSINELWVEEGTNEKREQQKRKSLEDRFRDSGLPEEIIKDLLSEVYSNRSFGFSDSKPYTVYPLCEFSNIMLAAEDSGAHPSYIKAGKAVCEKILSSTNEEPNNIKFAKLFLSKVSVA